MNIPKDILDKLCTCEDLSCPKPHTIRELELETGEIIVLPNVDKTAEYKPTCPVCKNDEETYGYEFKGQKEGYCNKCGNSFMEDGTLIIEEDLTDVSVKHVMIYDGNCYICDSCDFETIWMREANQHELVNDDKSSPTKSVKHTMILDQKMWHCTDCTFETELLTEVIAHEGNKDVKPETKQEEKQEEKHYTKWKEKDIWMCIYCPKTFSSFNDAIAHENDAGRKANPVTGYSTSSYKHCTHDPQEVLKGDDWSIWAGRKYDCENKLNQFDVVLNLTGSRISKRHEIPIKALKKWESREKFTEICLDWPDRGVVSLPKEFWKDLLNHLKTNKMRMVVFCVGGHGRTGTAISSLLVTAFGWSPKEATEWVWKNYCESAIETNGQIQYCYNLVGQTYNPPNTTKSETKTANQTSIINGWDND